MTILNVSFYECEHHGDLDNYIGDIVESGGKVIDTNIDLDDEVGYVKIGVEDKGEFLSKFKETDAYEFLN